MKTLEELGYERAEVKEGEVTFASKDVVTFINKKDRAICIDIDKGTKEVFKSILMNNSCIQYMAAWMTVDEMKAALAILEEGE